MIEIVKLAFKYIFAQKKRSLITIIGITLPIMLVVIVGQTFSSMNATQLYRVEKTIGAYHFFLDNLSLEQGQKLSKKLNDNDNIAKTGTTTDLGKCPLKDGRYISCIGIDDTAIELKSLELKRGRFPLRNDEACIEEWIIDSMDTKPEIGKEFELEIIKGSGEKIKQRFLLCGILKDTPYKVQSKDYGALLCVRNEAVESILGNQISAQVFSKFKHAKSYYSFKGAIVTICSEIYKEPYFANSNFNCNNDYFTELCNYEQNKGVQSLLIIIVLFAAALLIYNTFSITLAERIHQYGLLRCIGISRVQLFMTVVTEALLLGMVSIFAGLLLGYNMTFFVIRYFILGNSGQRIIVLTEMGNMLMAVIFGIVTVFLSSCIPAYKASKMSPIEASKTSGVNIRRNNKKSILEKIAGRYFDIRVNLAICSIKRYRTKRITTLMSLVISSTVLMFLLFFYFNYLGNSNKTQDSFVGDFLISVNSDTEGRYTKEDLQNIRQIKGITDIYGFSQSNNMLISFKVDNVNEVIHDQISAFMKDIGSLYPDIKNDDSDIQKGYIKFPVTIFGLDDCFIRKGNTILSSGKIDNEKMKAGQEAYILDFSKPTKDIFTPAQYLLPGQNIDILPKGSQATGSLLNASSFKIGGMIKGNFVTGDEKSTDAVVYLYKDVFDKLTKNKGYTRVFINIDKDADYKDIEKELQRVASSKIGGKCTNYIYEREYMKDSLEKYSLVLLAMILMIVIVSYVCVFNTLYSSVLLKTNELGMIRAIGMCKNEMKKMFTIESLYYGITSSLISIAISVPLCIVIFSQDGSQSTSKILTGIPWVGYLLIVVSYSLLCTWVMKISTSRVYKSSVVASIRVVE